MAPSVSPLLICCNLGVTFASLIFTIKLSFVYFLIQCCLIKQGCSPVIGRLHFGSIYTVTDYCRWMCIQTSSTVSFQLLKYKLFDRILFRYPKTTHFVSLHTHLWHVLVCQQILLTYTSLQTIAAPLKELDKTIPNIPNTENRHKSTCNGL